MTEERSVYGFPIKGDMSYRTETRSKQLSGKTLVTKLTKLIELGVDHVTWTQYTPHFNDGDICTFSANDIQVYAQAEYPEPLKRMRLERVYKNRHWDWELRGYKDDGFEEREVEHLYETGWDFQPSNRDDWPHPEFLPNSKVMKLAIEINDMITGGQFDNFLINNFGEGTEVTFNGETFTHEEYDHD